MHAGRDKSLMLELKLKTAKQGGFVGQIRINHKPVTDSWKVKSFTKVRRQESAIIATNRESEMHDGLSPSRSK